MKKLILILLSTVITSLQAQGDSDSIKNTSIIEFPYYLKNQTDLVLTKALKTIDNPLFSSDSISNYYSQYFYADYTSDFKRRE